MSRRYGQHFLKDLGIVQRIVEESGVSSDDVILEIGPGRGILTQELAKKARKVVAIEIDRSLAAELKAKNWPGTVEIHLGNILEFGELELKKLVGETYKIVTNLPYDITSEFLKKFLGGPNRPVSITVMIQKEVGERIVTKDGKWSRLAVFCGYQALTKMLFSVPPSAFNPPPHVDSCVIRLDLRTEPLLEPTRERLLFKLTEFAYAEKRKTLANSLRPILGSDAAAKLRAVGQDPQERPERITLAKWLFLAGRL
jgi:16S rRNA (adenine1518-N6/adenine1519-N6)-dimethyltransferase